MSVSDKSAVQGLLRIDVNAPITNEPLKYSATQPNAGSDSDENTMTSLEEQMNSFMVEMRSSSTNKKKESSTPKAKESSTPKAKPSPRPVESRTSIDAPIVKEEETRDDISIDSKPSFEKFKGSSLVKDRLKMFSGQASPSAATGKPPIITSGGGTKSVMKMW